MQQVLSSQLWRTVKGIATKSTHRQAAIAYVTRDLIGFQRGDLLITDASPAAVRAGETDAKLLIKLWQKGVVLKSCAGLHAKVMLFDTTAVIGSGNMSESSHSTLIEAALMTDFATTVSGVASFIAQLARQSKPLDQVALRRLCQIKVVRRGGHRGGTVGKRPKIDPLGQNTWLVTINEGFFPQAQEKLVDEATSALARKHEMGEDEINCIRDDRSGSFALRVRAGDQLIQLVGTTEESPKIVGVIKPVTVLLRKRHKRSTFFFLAEPSDRKPRIGWDEFQNMMERLGDRGPIDIYTERMLEPELAEAISRNWNSA